MEITGRGFVILVNIPQVYDGLFAIAIFILRFAKQGHKSLTYFALSGVKIIVKA
jgi:hypothetical protein